MLQPALTALEATHGATRALVISSGGPLTAVLSTEITCEKLTITPALLDSELWRTSLRNRPKFNLCLCDLAADDLVKFRKMLELIRPLLTEPSRIVVVHHPFGQAIDQWTYNFTIGLFPLVGRSQIAFAGSYLGALSVRWFTRALQRHNVAVPAGILSLAAILAVCAPLARLGSWAEQRREAQVLPVRCTSMTIAIDLP
jgi:hypothetical protein